MINAAKELDFELSQLSATLLAADIHTYDATPLTAVLPLNYTAQQLAGFWHDLSLINYDDGYGVQELFGVVWLSDNEWLARDEYDGAQRWNHYKYPQYPPRTTS